MTDAKPVPYVTENGTTKTRTKLAAFRRTNWEEVFANLQVEYDLKYVDLSRIKRVPEAQIRLSDVNPSQVRRYLRQFEAGSMPPPLTLWDAKDGTFDIVDANHRYRMFMQYNAQYEGKGDERTLTAVPAYVLSGDSMTSEVARWISAVLNQHGLPMTSREQAQAIRAGLRIQMTTDAIAKNIGVPRGRVNTIARIDAFNERAAKQGLITDGIAETFREKFNLSALPDAAVFCAAVELQRDAQMKSTEWADILSDLKSLDSEPARIQRLQREREDREPAIRSVKAGKSPMLSPMVEVRRVIEAYERTKAKTELDAWIPSGDTGKRWYDRMVDVRDHLGLVLKEAVDRFPELTAPLAGDSDL